MILQVGCEYILYIQWSLKGTINNFTFRDPNLFRDNLSPSPNPSHDDGHPTQRHDQNLWVYVYNVLSKRFITDV